MSERDEVQPQGSCPSSARSFVATLMAQPQGSCPSRWLPRQLGLTPQGARHAAAVKTNEVFRRRLTCNSRLSVAAEAIAWVIQRGCDNEVAVETNLQVMSELKNRATQQFARVAI